MQSVTSVLLVTKIRHDTAERTAFLMEAWLKARGVRCCSLSAEVLQDELTAAAREVGAVLILGGDGTFVGVCRKLAGLNLPVIGVNFGQVGFLAELSAQNWEPHLTRLLAGELECCPRLILGWNVRRTGTVVHTGYAINDVVVGRGALARVLPVRVRVQGEDLGRIRADGIIVSTPLGTSAYALSAHGPLVHPEVQALTITPISPFFKSFPPMVLPPQSQIELETEAESHDSCLTVDGQEGFPLIGGDVVHVFGVPHGLLLFTICGNSYYQRLRDRGFIESRTPVSSSELRPA
ncbi:MAG: NAD(+)/NADH kinase [Bilophila sp.]